MSIKQIATKMVRRLLPKGLVRGIEDFYRKLRIRLVSFRYGNPSKGLRVIAVTGTNGKTTTINYINSILKAAGLKTAMFSTALIEVNGEVQLNDLNATVGSTARMQRFFKEAKRAGVDFVVLEITSHALHQHKLSTVPIEVAVMTNLTQDHLDYHKTMNEYAKAKGILFKNKPRYIVLNSDDEWFSFFNQYQAGESKVSYGKSADSNFTISNVKLGGESASALVESEDVKFKLHSSLPGLFNIYNATAAAAATSLLGIKANSIEKGVRALSGIPGRFERIANNKGFDVIVDYAHTPDAIEKLLSSVKATAKGRVVIVFGACGDRDKTKRPIMGKIAANLADKIILTDEESYNENPAQIRSMIYEGITKAGGKNKTTEIEDRGEAIKAAIGGAKTGDVILVTGMGHEQYRIVNGKRLPWSDAEAVRSFL